MGGPVVSQIVAHKAESTPPQRSPFHLFHRWSKWTDVGQDSNGWPWQERRCMICGKRDWWRA